VLIVFFSDLGKASVFSAIGGGLFDSRFFGSRLFSGCQFLALAILKFAGFWLVRGFGFAVAVFVLVVKIVVFQYVIL
jgi:hypothetical protein